MQYLPKQRSLCTAIAMACSLLVLSSCGKGESAKAANQASVAKVGVVVVQSKPFEQYSELQGRTSAYLVSEVRPQVSGIVQKRLFVEGGLVKAGQSLYQIDPSTYQAIYASAKAALEKAQANLAAAKVKQARYQDLVKINAVSQQDFDDANAALKQTQADVSAAQAAVDAARINLAYTQVKAPISGRIGRSSVTPGALVQQGQATALATIQQLDPIYVNLTQTTTDLLALKRQLASGKLEKTSKGGAKVKLTLEDGTPYPKDGDLQFSDVTVDPTTGSVTLRAVFPNPDGLLLPGMYVRAALNEGTLKNAILVPQQAIARDSTGSAVALVLNDKNIVEQRRVETEKAVGDQWLIASGLKAGDRLIVRGLQKVKPGQPAALLDDDKAPEKKDQ
ncbi:efflux RND transporter periplasmic adaptor subunit [Limnobacter sp.]|uniref:efflux RND transporter periplasmic adaptor subunit n=1 Tax=Limnobacter sp. TaxID=2003368 RepID=UPI00258C3C60|nr:efflux RND transporter periplasmic adaptor subunit [Limnobacter sp.]